MFCVGQQDSGAGLGQFGARQPCDGADLRHSGGPPFGHYSGRVVYCTRVRGYNVTDEPPEIGSDGETPTNSARDAQPSASLPSDERRTLFDEEARRLLDPGTELGPELAAEHRAVYLRAGDVVANRFQVVKLLGFGGMGAVYHVKDRRLHDQDQALKVMLPSLLASRAARNRFLKEVTISKGLSDPGIVRVHDLGEDERGFRFFTMEYLEGKTLHRVLKERGGKLHVDEALNITRQLCDALEYAHQHTIHRDLKPQNIMVQPDGRIKILDFGLAKAMSFGGKTLSNVRLGTPDYMAPEQRRHAEHVDLRADIFSVGVMLYEMLTGGLPNGWFEPPSAHDRWLPKALDAVVLRCLSTKPDSRYSSASELREALDGAVLGTRRRTRLVAMVVLLLLAMGGSSAYFVYHWPSKPSYVDSSSKVVGVPEESPQVPPAIPPAVTAENVSLAKSAAQQAEQEALEADAETYAAKLLEEGRELLEKGDTFETSKEFRKAEEKYAEAERAFSRAIPAALVGVRSDVEAEKAELESVKSQQKQAQDELDALNQEYVTTQEAFEDLQNQASIVQARQLGLKAEVQRLTGMVGELEDANAKRAATKDALAQSVDRLYIQIKEGMPLTPAKYCRADRLAAAEDLAEEVAAANWVTPALLAAYTRLYQIEMEIAASTEYFFAKIPITTGAGVREEQWAECLMRGNWRVIYRTLDGKSIGAYEDIAEAGEVPVYGFREQLPKAVKETIEKEILASRPPDYESKRALLAEKQIVAPQGEKAGFQRAFDEL